MTVFITGRISLLVLAVLYSIAGGLLILRRDTAHRVKIYHQQAYIDCAVDGDDDPYTCVSDYTVVKTLSFNAGYVFGWSLLMSGILSLLQIMFQRNHVYSTVYYVDTVVSNSIMTFAVAVVTGVQGLSTLILMMMNTIVYELGMYYHDRKYWESPCDVPYNRRGRFFTYALLNLITLSINLAATIEYWHVSHIPSFIPLIMLVWFTHFIMLRYFAYRYFYGTLPAVLKKGLKSERDTLFEKVGETPSTKYDIIVKEDSFCIDWHDSWKNAINFFFKMSIGLVFYIGTNNVKITYK